MNAKEKMLELIKRKQAGNNNQVTGNDTPKNDRKKMRKGPKIFNKYHRILYLGGDYLKSASANKAAKIIQLLYLRLLF